MKPVLLVVALAFGCQGKAKSPPPEPDRPTITVEERVRTVDGCKAYAEKICACATAHPDKAEVVELCKTDQALPAALDMVLATMDHPESNRNDVLLSKQNVQKIGASCFERIGRLPALGCE